ncbi:MAG: ATP-binding protein [Mariprofundaceae bacterium]
MEKGQGQVKKLWGLISGQQIVAPDSSHNHLLKMVLGMAIPTLFGFSTFNYFMGLYSLSVIELSLALLLLPMLFSCCIRKVFPQRFVEFSVLLVGIVIFQSLLTLSSYARTGIYWVPIFPFLAFLLVGLKRGWIWVLSFIIVTIFSGIGHQLQIINMAYSMGELTMFAASFTFYTLVAAIFQGNREKHNHTIAQTNQQLRLARASISTANKTLEQEVQARTRELTAEIQQHKKTNQALHEKELQFHQAQKMDAVGTLVGGVAHDFNNMLSGINANLFIIKRRSQDNPNIQKHLKSIEQLVFHAAKMITQLLTFARKDHIELESFNANTFFNEAYKLSQVAIPENIQLHQDFPSESLLIQGNATQLQQVMMNLVNNAKDSLQQSKKPEILIKLTSFKSNENFRHQHPKLQQKRYICLSISDNGCGISENNLEQIFEPFFTTKDVGKGTGLGLAMCYGAIQSHGGLIEVKSQLGQGTTFSIYLPVVEQLAPRLEISHDTHSQAGHGETILLVDDHEISRVAHSEALQSLGYHVIEASDGHKAIQAFKQFQSRIKLTVMDVMMPKMGGVEAAKHIHKISPEAPIIFATGYDKDKTLDGRHPLESGHHVLIKPLSISTLTQAIQEHILQ